MGSKYKGNEKVERALNTYIRLMRAAESVTARVTRHLAAAELTISQFDVLEAVYHLGPLCQRDIARKIRKTTGNITMVIDNLEKRSLVKRVRTAEDRRFLTIHLTETGKRLIGEVFARHAAAITEDISFLTAAEQEELGRLCRKVGLKEKGVDGG
jgi:MarR family 2-MHQ and catechol resistance regulon transcriptional repressor